MWNIYLQYVSEIVQKEYLTFLRVVILIIFYTSLEII